MEEISSLDSFQTEGGDTATPRQDSTTPKLDEEQTESPGTLEKTDMPKSVESIEADETANTNSRNEVPIEDEEHASATNEDDFEQVSDGTFEVDDNSQETSTEPSQLVRDESANDKTNDADTETSVNEEEKSDRLEATTAADPVSEPQETLESEIVTVSNTPANLENKADEVDIFDQLHKGTSSDTDVVDAAPSSEQPSAMDVDEDEDKADDNVLADSGDVEMQSANNSPKYVNDGNDDGANISNVEEGKDVVDGDEVAHEVTEDATSEKNDDEAADEVADEGADGDDFDPNVSENIEDDAEHGDEPVENVQEPEESDVCLIPDDTETQMTEAEKEQAILARENAEKQELEEAAAEKAIAAEKAVAADHEKETSGTSDNRESSATDEAHVAADAQANKQAGAEADSSSKGGEESVAADGADPNEGDEQMSEEVVGTTNEAGSVSKTIISWVVSTVQTCKRCEEEKTCGFRVKKLDDSHGYEFYCDQSCCDALLKDNPGKYFIRRKKFLVEEVSNEESSISSASPKTTDREPSESEIDEPTNVVSNRTHSCLQCKETKQCKYFIKQEQDTFYICNDDCFNLLNVEEPDKFKLKRHSIRVRNIGATTISSGSPAKKSNESRVVARTNAEAEAARQARIESFRRRCSECHEEVVIDEKHLLWETMDFCNELCLGKYQRTIGANCQTCNGEVSQTALGKYCVRFGFEVRQFCCAACLNVYKKGLKTCSCCQKDISSGSEGFLAPVGDKEQFKDFCSQACLRRYDGMCNPKKKLRNDICAVCNNEKTVRVEMILEEKEQYFCSNPCFSAFKFVSNIDADQCGMCCKYFERKSTDNFTIYDDSEPKVFCSRICINVFIIVNRHIVSCQWCKVKKYNFDMIYKRLEDREILTCSLTCLSMYGVSMKAFSRAVTKCDQCSNATTPQYHLTMSDASIRNFCTYQCVMQFQSQFSRVPLTLENELPSSSNNKTQQQQNSSHSVNKNGAPFPTGLPKRVKIKYNQTQPAKNTTTASNKKNSGPVVPVISTVTSLASGETEAMIGSVTVRRGRGRGRKVDSPPPLAPVTGFLRGRPRKYVDYSTRTPSPVSTLGSRRSSIAGGQTAHSTVGNDYAGVPQTETKIITLPPYPTTVRNVSTSCKPQAVSVGFQCTPETREIGVQTEKDYSNKVLIPVPVPIYVPQPMYMYSAPFPVPVPIPLPIPVPIFIPTTRNSAQGILKEIKKIQERMPTDPLEAELLMMAEMVAEEKHDSDSDSDNEIKPDPGIVQLQYNNTVQQDVEVAANNTYGEDVLQMALKMATGDDYDQQPTVDLESAMTANTISNPPPEMVGHDTMGHMNVHQLDQHMLDAQRVGRGRKRSVVATTPVTTPARNNRSPVKRQRLQELESPIQQVAQHSPQQHQPTEKPDANMCLKYTFGVNAWKQWVMTKNADIEKSSMRRRTFKTDLLQMTADELNYSLCLFVKEVRKPNGTEYAPDTIYYLVLGIQQYLYVNGRIDNIFYDPYYERFTECLDEVARKFSVLYNDSQYIVTRVEEEHLWECKQLGAHSPHVLLSTLMFFNTKHFNLTTVEEHMQLSFSHIMKHWKRSAQNAKMPGTRNVLLRFYPPAASSEANPRKKKVYEQQENEENPLRCPVRLYEFYLSKCPESVKTRNDVFYLQPERSCVPDSPVWYSTQALSQDSLQRMLHRVKMVKEINIALLTS